MLPKVKFCKECKEETIHCCKKKQQDEEKAIVYCGMMMPKKIYKQYQCMKCGKLTDE